MRAVIALLTAVATQQCHESHPSVPLPQSADHGCFVAMQHEPPEPQNPGHAPTAFPHEVQQLTPSLSTSPGGGGSAREGTE